MTQKAKIAGTIPPPSRPGFYWAQWRTAEAGTQDEGDLPPADTWDVVDVVENHMDPQKPEYLIVMVVGVSRAQSIENFIWGPGPLAPPA